MLTITNAQRLQMEIGIEIPFEQTEIYLLEEGLNAEDTYDPTSNQNKRQILATALAVLNSIANNITHMKNYKEDDISVSQFAENLRERIDQLERKLRMTTANDESNNNSNAFMLFSN